MISNQILQSTVDGLKSISRIDFSIMDTEGESLAFTSNEIAVPNAELKSFISSSADSQQVQDLQFFKIYEDSGQLEYVLIASGGDDAHMVGRMAVFQIQSLLEAYKDRFDKDDFIKTLLLDNLLLVDIHNRAKKLHIQTNLPRAVFLIENESNKNSLALDILKGLSNVGNTDFITAVDEQNVIIVHELKTSDSASELKQFAKGLLPHLEKGGLRNSRISYGTVIDEIKDVSRSYKEAKMALDVGKIFFEERNVIAYGSLGIGRLIYQLPINLCEMFIREVFQGKVLEDFDEELLATVNKFFEYSLNVSETSRQLYIHRNTLVYRLDKLQKTTGLDLKVFEDAITFKIALMVAKYMKYKETVQF